ncbi:hypothetical protein [Embleya scabrispora]|uniref:hypothetical protein n=1 Tax=Embleya scabrispora TaxID=159449 RepID=UPI000381A57B|nr:hypothetical protein [Embleya scabrispora]MYS84050.1 hypothetical protein [Streptomyces sp. SID5474]
MTKPVGNANAQPWGNEKSTDTPHRLTADDRHTGLDGSFGSFCYTPTPTTSMSSIRARFQTENSRLWKVSDGTGDPYFRDSPNRHDVTTGTSIGTVKASAQTARACGTPSTPSTSRSRGPPGGVRRAWPADRSFHWSVSRRTRRRTTRCPESRWKSLPRGRGRWHGRAFRWA